MIYRFGNYSEYWQILLLYKNGDGNGITPVMPAFWTKFMVAETQMLEGNVVGAKTTVFEGIIMSIDKVINFALQLIVSIGFSELLLEVLLLR